MPIAAEGVIWELITHDLDDVQSAVFRLQKAGVTVLRFHGCLAIWAYPFNPEVTVPCRMYFCPTKNVITSGRVYTTHAARVIVMSV